MIEDNIKKGMQHENKYSTAFPNHGDIDRRIKLSAWAKPLNETINYVCRVKAQKN